MVLLGSHKPQTARPGLRLGAHRSWLVAILVVAAAARLWGVAHDLPFVYYYDETHLMNRAVGFGKGDLNPHWFHKPALYMYVLFALFGAYFVLGRLTGRFASVDAFAVHYPQATVHIEYHRPDRVYELVAADRADLGFVSYPQASRTIAALPWCQEPMVLVCAVEHPLGSGFVFEPSSVWGSL